MFVHLRADMMIGAEGAAALADALEESDTVKSLTLRSA